ncbi:MAG TPA: PfkB family carbohydrate kinase [Patescibacteria group bacterium]|nr:PfkB family carbohydrate kinase [Patescibacteria group bacterium]
MFDVITIGDSTVDSNIIIDHQKARVTCDLKKENCLLCFNYADKVPIEQTVQSIGGNAANVAVGCRRLGLKTAIVTELGADLNGQLIKEELERAEVDIRWVHLWPKQETRFSVVLNYQGERTILAYHVPRRYTLPALATTRWIYFTSLGASHASLQANLLKYLKAHPEIKLACNPGSFQIKDGLKTLRKILPRLDLLFVNKQEAEKIVGGKEIETNMARFHKLGIKIVVITDSTQGSYLSSGQERYHLPSYPLKPLAKTGAGDAYASGFLSALTAGKSLTEAMQWGTANAGGVVQKIGAQKGLLTKAGVQKIIRRYSKIVPQKI